MLISFCNNDGSHFVIQENVRSRFTTFGVCSVATSDSRGGQYDAQSVTMIYMAFTILNILHDFQHDSFEA